MFKSLIRTLPSLSGNVKLVCDVSDIKNIVDNSDEYIDCYVNYASLEPISKNVYKQPININLFKSRYDYDLSQFYNIYNDIFYKSCYNYSKVDAKKIDKSHEANERDKDFEFGCSRISYKENNKQFSFFAPIYIDNVFDIPNAFIIEANIRYGEYIIKKKLRINIASNIDLSDSKTNIIYSSNNILFNYIYNYVFNIDDKVIYIDYVDANNSNNNNVYYYGIDLKRGGFTRTQDITVNKIFSDQQTINNFDNIICSGFKNTNICMKQILPLCFNFNIDDLFTGYNASKLYLSDITFSGYYINKNNKIEELYDFDIDYSKFALNILDINDRTGDIISIPGMVDNMMDYSFPSLHEKYFYKYQFMNKISPNTTRWILAASNVNTDENYNYIINNNIVFSINQDSQYKYRYFPVEVNNGNNVGCCNKISLDTENVVNDYNYIYNSNNIYVTKRNRVILYNLLLPIENKISTNIEILQREFYDNINDLFSILYKKDKISNCYDFFNVIYHDNKIYTLLNEDTGVIKREIDYIKYINPSNGYKLLQSTSNDNISIFDKNGINYNKLWKTPINDYVYYNDILYNLNNLYINNNVVKLQDRYNKFLEGDTEIYNSLFEIAKQNKNAQFIDNTNYDNYLALQKITKFGVFAIPFFNVINNKQIKKLYNVNNLFTLINKPSSSKYDDIVVSSNILNKEHIDNKIINFYNTKDTISFTKLNTTIDVNNSLYIDDLSSKKWNDIFLTEGHLISTQHTYNKQVIIDGETQNILINYNTYSMSEDWIDKYSTNTSYAYMFCDYDDLETRIKNDNTYNYSYSNIYVDVDQIKSLPDVNNEILKDENNIINAYELVPVYDIKLICGTEKTQNNTYININTLNTKSDIKFNNNDSSTNLYYKLQDNSIINTNNSVLNSNSINNTFEKFLPVSNVTTNGKLLLMDDVSVHSINDYNLYDYTLYNKRAFIEINTSEKYNKIINNHPNIDIYSFKPYVKYNGNTIVKNIMMKRQFETEFDGDLIKNENDIDYLWTDVYNLAILFKEHNDLKYDSSLTREFYFDFINREHLKKYLEYVSADENNQHLEADNKTKILLEDWKYRSAFSKNDDGTLKNQNTPFTELYSCEKVLIIDPKTKLISIKYRYEKFVYLIRRSFIEHGLDDYYDNTNANNYLKTYTLYDLCRNITFKDNTSFVDINISFSDVNNTIHNWVIPHVHLVYKKKFYPVNEDIMVKLANLFNDDDTPTNNDNEVWCDFYFAKTRSNLEYDILSKNSKYTILSTNEIDYTDNNYTFIDNDMSNLTPIFNDVYYEERENTKISTLININDINACKKVIRTKKDDKIEIRIEKRYRYAKNKYNNFITLNTLSLNKILSIYNEQIKKEVEQNNVSKPTTLETWISTYLSKVNIFRKYNTTTNFVTLLGPNTNDISNTSNSTIIQTNFPEEYDYLGLSKYNIFTYYKDGEIYGFYLFAININNTSEMFDVLYGFDVGQKSIKLSSSNVSKFDAFNNHPFFAWNQIKKEDNTNNTKYNIVYNYLYNIDGIKYFISNIKTIMPITNISIMKHLYEISDIVSKPSITNLNINYITKTFNSSNNSNECNIVYSKKSNNDIVSLKKLKMTRYFCYILPRMKSVDKLIHDKKFNYVFNLKCKWVDNAILEDGIYNSINDTPLDFWIDGIDKEKDRNNNEIYNNFNIKNTDYSTIFNIYKYAPISIFDISNNTTIKNYNNFIENYTEPEYKHFNCSKLYNLIPQIIINDNNKYTYQEILNMSTDTICINKFINYITNYNNSRYKRSHTSEYDDNLTYSELLFLYNRYKCTIKTNCVGVNNNDLKLFTIQYIYDLL